MTTTTKAANRAQARIMAAKSDLWESQFYTTGAARRARRTAKREAVRAARRIPVALDVDDDGPDVETPETGAAGKWIHVVTQYLENYGDASDPYWKSKGGETFVLAFDAPLNAEIGRAAKAAVDAVRADVEYSNAFAQSYILDWYIVENPITEDERLQLEYDGRIDYPSPRIGFAAAA